MASTSIEVSFNTKIKREIYSGNAVKKAKEPQITVSTYSISWTSRLSHHLHLSPGPIYKLTTFTSKGAALVLALNFLVWAGYGVMSVKGNSYYFYSDPRDKHRDLPNDQPLPYLRDTIPILFWFPAVLVFGLLADVQYGRKKVVFFGILLVWLARIVDCIRVTVFYYSPDSPAKTTVTQVVFIVDSLLSYVAVAAFLVNSVQLAIDQLTDASANQISSFIRWSMFTASLGAWTFNILTDGPLFYCVENKRLIKALTSLAQVVFTSSAVCLVTLCGEWIKPIPTGDNPLKLIWRVLRFSAKHKYPVSRSALTYWEEDIPSRINLGKDKYGGPFTNEQVEDVKTFFRMVCLTIPALAAVTAYKLIDNNFVYAVHSRKDTLMDFNYTRNVSVGDSCKRSWYATFPSSTSMWICLYFLCSEFVISPLVSRCIPGMLKRIGVVFFLTVLVSIVLLVLNVVALTHSPLTIDRFHVCCAITAISALQLYLLFSSTLEFICAQSPQSMKGLLIGFMWFNAALLSVIAYFVYYLWSMTCTRSGCGTAYFSVVALLGVVGFVVYCVVAKRYRHRERDDCPNDQAIIEEVFARRLANKRKRGVASSTT